MKFTSMREVEDRINKNYKCIKELEQVISLKKTDNEKLDVISLIGKMYAEYTTGVYSSNILEKQIVEIGQKIDFVPCDRPKDHHILIVMSECGAVGGHTVLVHNWIKWDNINKYSIVFTNMEADYVPEFIKEVIDESGGKLLYLSGDYMEKAQKLLEISQKFYRILIFTHMEDILPNLAYGNKNWKTPVYFYNHADFKFSYGFSVSDIVLNLCEFDVDKTIRYRGVDKKNSIFLQFPEQGKFDKKIDISEKSKIREKIEQRYGIEKDEKLIVSMGEDFKYENVVGYEFDAYVNAVINQYNQECSFLIIGADREKEKWISLEKKTHGKARALGILPRDEAEQIILAADLYIVSFPMAASGMHDAEEAKVPYLQLNIYGRGINENDIRISNSIEELIEKTLEVLNGKKEKYLDMHNTGIWTKRQWNEKWQSICESTVNHIIHSIYPKRHLEKQEFINCQLLQEKAAQKLYVYIERFVDERIKRQLLKLDRKYDMGISCFYLTLLEKKCKDLTELYGRYQQLSKKHLRLYLAAIKWIKIKQEERHVDKYLFEQGYRTVAIYGMGYMGECLVNELIGGSVEIVYGIDRNAERLHSKIMLYQPTDIVPQVDVIINTTTFSNSEILKEMGLKNIRMLQLDDLLNMIC